MKQIYRSIKYILLECLAIFPILLWLNTLLLKRFFDGYYWLLIPAVYILFSLVGRVLSKINHKVLLSILMTISLIFILSLDSIWQQMIMLIILFVSSLRGYQYSQEDISDVLPIGLIWSFSLPSYFISYILYRGQTFENEQQLLTTLALILLFFLLFLTNQDHLSKASLVKRQMSQMNKKLKLQNYLYVFVFFMIMLLITRYNFIASGILLLLKGLFKLLGMGKPEESITEDVIVDMEMPDLGPPPEPSRWAEIIDQILMIVGYGILIIVSLIIIYYLIKKIPFFANKIKLITEKIMEMLLRIRKGRKIEHHEAYYDETESVFDFAKSVDQFVDRFKQRFTKRINWDELSDRQKARMIYKVLIGKANKQGFEFFPYETAKEAIIRLERELIHDKELLQSLVSIYDQARYSSLTVEQIEDLKMAFERNGWLN